MSIDFSAETTEARESETFFKAQILKNLLTRNLCVVKIPFANEGKLKTFSDKTKKIHCQ